MHELGLNAGHAHIGRNCSDPNRRRSKLKLKTHCTLLPLLELRWQNLQKRYYFQTGENHQLKIKPYSTIPTTTYSRIPIYLDLLACRCHCCPSRLLYTSQNFYSRLQQLSLLHNVAILAPQTVYFGLTKAMHVARRQSIERPAHICHKIFDDCVCDVANE